MNNLVKVYCQEKTCRYHKTSCCVAEISAESLKKDPNAFTRSRCQIKGSIKVIGRPISAA